MMWTHSLCVHSFYLHCNTNDIQGYPIYLESSLYDGRFLFELISRNGDIQEPFSLVPTATVSSFYVFFNTDSWFSYGKNTIHTPAITQCTPSISLIHALIIPLSFLSLRLVLLSIRSLVVQDGLADTPRYGTKSRNLCLLSIVVGCHSTLTYRPCACRVRYYDWPVVPENFLLRLISRVCMLCTEFQIVLDKDGATTLSGPGSHVDDAC